MEYKNQEMTIRELLDMIKKKSINLHPVYQRNFIWNKKEQKSLIDSIYKNYPMPNFFIRELGSGKYEMVDGQQRATTISKYYNGDFVDSNKRTFEQTEKEKFLNYRLNVVFITENDIKIVEEFFYLVNKLGVHLNPAEINHAYYHDSDFASIVNKIMDNQNLVDLDIFTDKAVARMSDSSLIEELLAYLFSGITDKKLEVERLLREKISLEEQEEKYQLFCKILDILSCLDKEVKAINETRFKQRNDFYTLFCFVHEHLTDDITILKEQYRLLAYISDKGYITPSNEQCEPFKMYAIDCVSQSNSKKARENRLFFLNNLLCSTNSDDEMINDILAYINTKEDDFIDFMPNFKYSLIDITSVYGK